MLIAFDCSISTSALLFPNGATTLPVEWVLEVGCIKPVNVLRYSDAVGFDLSVV